MVVPGSPKRSRRVVSSRGIAATAAAVSTILLLLTGTTLVKLRSSSSPRWVHLQQNRNPREFWLYHGQDKIEYGSTMKYIKKKPTGVDGDIDRTTDLKLTRPKANDGFGALEPMWQCRDPHAMGDGRVNKILFVNAPDIAEATIFRAVLEAFSHHCHAGMAIVGGCSSLTLQSIREGSWRNGKGSLAGATCRMRKVVKRNLDELIELDFFNTTFLEQHVDILSGVPIGADAYWTDEGGTNVDVQYVTFFQDPVRVYVSRTIENLRGKKMSFNKTIDRIKKNVREERKYGQYYSQFTSYLITPEQHEQFDKAGIIPSQQSTAYLAMDNLLKNNALIGIAERVPESVELLKHVLDRAGYLDSMFEYFGLKNATGISRAKVVKNPSSKYVKELEKDKEFMNTLREYLKWDQEIHDFALDLHKRQYKWIKQQQGTLDEEG